MLATVNVERLPFVHWQPMGMAMSPLKTALGADAEKVARLREVNRAIEELRLLPVRKEYRELWLAQVRRTAVLVELGLQTAGLPMVARETLLANRAELRGILDAVFPGRESIRL